MIDDVVVWKILKDGESFSLNEDAFVLPDTVEYNADVTEELLNDPTDFFLKYIFPDVNGKLIVLAVCYIISTIMSLIHFSLHHFISGHAKMVDKFFRTLGRPYYDTVIKD